MKMADISALTHEITLEFLKAFGLPMSKWAQITIGSLFKKPATKFSEMMAFIDQTLAQYGLREAARKLLPMFVDSATASGVEYIPDEGPLIIISNHPGTIDGAAILANVSREDIKLIAGPIPFLDNLPNLREILLFSHRTSVNARATTVRRSIEHLKNKGALLIFPSGQIDPDPEVLPGASESLEKWSRSIALMLRQVPETKVLPAITSGVLAKKITYTPFTILRKDGVAKRRIMEFIQTIQQIVSEKRFGLTPHVTFAPSLGIKELGNVRDTDHVMRVIITRAKHLLAQHMTSLDAIPSEG